MMFTASKSLVVCVVALLAAALLPPGIICSTNYGKGLLLDGYSRALRVQDGSLANGAKYQTIANFDRTDPSYYFNTGEWLLDSVLSANTSFNIKTPFSGKCMTAQTTSWVTQEDCTTASNQLWRFYESSSLDGFIQLWNEGTHKCITFQNNGGIAVTQFPCSMFGFGAYTAWTIEHFAVSSQSGFLKSVSTGKCLIRYSNGRYGVTMCTTTNSAQRQHLWIWDNTDALHNYQPWFVPNNPARVVTASSDNNLQFMGEEKWGSGELPSMLQWINIGNVEYQFQIKNVGSGYCVSTDLDSTGQYLKLAACDGSPKVLWTRSHVSPILLSALAKCYLHSDCLSNLCIHEGDKPGQCWPSQTGEACRVNSDCSTGKCRLGSCACITTRESRDSIKTCNTAFPGDCCSGNCEANGDGVGICGCHSYWQPCELDSDCCSQKCDPVYKICACVKTGTKPVAPVDAGGLGLGLTTLPQLCCSGVTDPTTSACATGTLGTYCESNAECTSNNCKLDYNFCACGSSNCATEGTSYCESCFGKGSQCWSGQCCYGEGVAVPCNARSGADGRADNKACCTGRCADSYETCVAGRLDQYCVNAGPQCIKERSIFPGL